MIENLSETSKMAMQHRLALLDNKSLGVSVYAVYADYRPKPVNHAPYYVMARSKKEAKERFGNIFTWLKIYRCEELDYNDSVRMVQDPVHGVIM